LAKLKLAVVGVGNFGEHHVRVLKELPKVSLVGVVDIDRQRGKFISKRYRVPFYPDCEPLLGKVDAVSIAVPTCDHFSIASRFIEQGIHVFLEKPMTKTLEEADSLIEVSEKNGAILQVGYIERYNPAVEAALKLIDSPLVIEAERIGRFVPRSLDIDVVLDLMIHDIDIALMMAKSPVVSVYARGASVITDRVDVANARLTFESGCVGEFMASRVSTSKLRKVRVFQQDSVITLDYITQEVELEMVTRSKRDKTPQLAKKKIKTEREEPLKKELSSFLEAVKNKSLPRVTAREARGSLAIAFEIIEGLNIL
jgi:predicted dehydrogenase